MNTTIGNDPQRRSLLKGSIDLLCLVITTLLTLLFRLVVLLAPGRKDTSYQGFTQRLSLLPGLPGVFLRRAFARQTLLACGQDCHIGFGTVFATPDVVIHDRVYIGVYGNIGHADVGQDVLIGSNVTIMSGTRQHHFERSDIPINRQGGEYRRVTIGTDVWIGNGAILTTDVAAHAVVGAGSVVTKPVATYAIVAGNPAKVVGHRQDTVSSGDLGNTGSA